jgi:hypothetical protein
MVISEHAINKNGILLMAKSDLALFLEFFLVGLGF